ncbi:GNAT family N-acetyltransferase [Pseudalkalibacillus sp. Hm43]|uniref:GNAT family N-acetyltransferase n=1 Tax=Pseudalkalibacillus sp. Hm43 TaxID=3450742 RepID=UPI003F43EDF1
MVRFTNMTEKQFHEYRARSLAEYAENIRKNYDVSEEVATEQATDQFDELLKNGLHTENHSIYHVTDEETEENVGIIWYSLRQETEEVFLYEIWMDPEFRGKGYGTQSMKELHRRAKELGAKKVGLHVFGQNTGAITLYKRLGYVENSIVMQYQL